MNNTQDLTALREQVARLAGYNKLCDKCHGLGSIEFVRNNKRDTLYPNQQRYYQSKHTTVCPICLGRKTGYPDLLAPENLHLLMGAVQRWVCKKGFELERLELLRKHLSSEGIMADDTASFILNLNKPITLAKAWVKAAGEVWHEY